MAQMRLAVGTEAILRAAVSYLRRGWAVVPVKHKTKRPVIAGWPQLRLSESDLAQHFGCVQKNIGLVLGESSAGLVDVDPDSTEALKLAPVFLPDTDCIFGRQSKRLSYWLYTVTSTANTTKLQLPRKHPAKLDVLEVGRFAVIPDALPTSAAKAFNPSAPVLPCLGPMMTDGVSVAHEC